MEMDGIHVGKIVRNIIPAKMTINEAAELLKIHRSGLSNLIHGNRDLSISLAVKIEDVFYYKAIALLEHQVRYKYLIYRQTIGSTILPVERVAAE